MSDRLAIELKNVTKTYGLYGSQYEQLMDVFGLNRLGFGRRKPVKQFAALDDVSLRVRRGHRIGIVGRNGAGKTTLLKLICGNFAPTSGTVHVEGDVQALLHIGLGFHPDFTGLENVKASLQYNGLDAEEYAAAVDDIVDFCELGDFLYQPFKTYSLGMQARLMFATSTAIRPDILIVDEVLGAGDAYFIAKSKQRVERLVSGGATMLLVSHSTPQVLELCEEVIWMDGGKIRMQGESFVVIKAYEEYLHGPISKLLNKQPTKVDRSNALVLEKLSLERELRGDLQVPAFQPHAKESKLPTLPVENANVFNFQARGGISRWDEGPGLKFCGFSIVGENGETDQVIALQPLKMILFLRVEVPANYSCRYGLVIQDSNGVAVTRIYSPPDHFLADEGEIRRVEMVLNPNQLGPGEYTVGITVHDDSPLELINSAKRYDLLGRSFSFSVKLPDSLLALSAGFFHSAEWTTATVLSKNTD